MSKISSGKLGSGCGTVGRVVTSDTRGPWFESSLKQIFIQGIYLLSTVLKGRKQRKKRGC